MNRGVKTYKIISLASAFAVFFSFGTALAAYEIKMNISSPGTGSGNVFLSATSSGDYEFIGWDGDDCSGRFGCSIQGLNRFSLKKNVTAIFDAPICKEFIYSNFGQCQLSGVRYREVVASFPVGCAGGTPSLIEPCFYNFCTQGLTYNGGSVNTGGFWGQLWGNAKNTIGGMATDISNGNLGGALNKAVGGFSKAIEIVSKSTNTVPELPYIPTDQLLSRGTGPYSGIITSGSAGGFSSPGGGVINLPDGSGGGGETICGDGCQPSIPVFPKIPDILLPDRNTNPIDAGPVKVTDGSKPVIGPDILPPEASGFPDNGFSYDPFVFKDPASYCK